jgi:hypothetical protein
MQARNVLFVRASFKSESTKARSKENREITTKVATVSFMS